MEWVYKIITRVEFYVLCVLVAAATIFFSIFKDVPHPGNGFGPTVRESMLLPLFGVGLSILVVGVVAFFVRDQTRGGPAPSRKKRRDAEEGDEAESDEGEHPTPSSGMNRRQGDELERTYRALSDTQQKVVTHICQMTVTQMTVDDFYRSFGQKFNPEWVNGGSEMYYRLKVLHYEGFCRLEKIGPGASVIVRIPEISRCLRERELLRS